jgi:DNA-binding NtrC family response regulator
MNGSPFKVFVVEDNEWFNRMLVHSISLNPDYQVESYASGKDFLADLHKMPDAVTLDYRLPDMTGDEVLRKIREFNNDIEVIIISEQENIETAVELLQQGAYDYIVKSKEIRDRLLNTLARIHETSKLKAKVVKLQGEVEQRFEFHHSIIGNSNALRKVFHLISKAIETNITVMVTGETGTGKELVAKAIHFNSGRKNNSFVAVNMAAIPAELIESELFGHEKGAFTGATARRTGKFQEADSGTLFLDEIGEMDQSMQAKLLRVLQEKEITPVGSNKVLPVDCRIIVATNRDLRKEVKAGRFREDLYFRLFGLPIELPPLRERDKDVLVLAKHFMDSFCRENGLPEKSIAPAAQRKLLAYSFPGNVRELKSVIDLAVVMAGNNEIGTEDVMLRNDEETSGGEKDLTLREHSLRILQAYLKKYDNNIPLVASQLDISQSTIYRMLKE